MPRKIRVILTRTFFARYFLNWKIITLYVTLCLTPEENTTCSVVLKIHIFINFQFEKREPVITHITKIGPRCVILKLLTCPADSVLTKKFAALFKS